MRASLLVVGLLSCPPALADLFTAQLAYQKGDYERAFHDYRELAEIGQPVAQFNLAVMYAKGQGAAQSDVKAYAWASVAAENGQARAQSLAEALRVTSPATRLNSRSVPPLRQHRESSAKRSTASARRSRRRMDCTGT